MDEWSQPRALWERIRYARTKAGFERAVDAAESLGIKPGTYRTYERSPERDGREPPLTEIQRMARKFKVDWVWLASGDVGHGEIIQDERVAAAARKARELDPDKADEAWTAVMGVLEAFKRRVG